MRNSLPLLTLALASLLAAGPSWAHGGAATAQADKHGISADQEAFGRQGDPKKVSRTIDISMHDNMRYNQSKITVRQGETLRIVLLNKGKIMHELVLGTEQKLKEHAEVMKKFPNMEHDSPYMAHVPPSKQQEIIWEFNKPGEFMFGCLIPGHFEAGMVGRITVLPAKP
ncbi:cupredoxin domain-containing protein [Chitinimonas sp. JJ19]|uniref:cupredoxin domain-containing protein n=1 Tax=Chitinimonas sp. JJ19 TaxID=3109352 RepID=UPI003001B0A5